MSAARQPVTCLLFIALITCADSPVLVGVERVEEVVTAVLPWRVRELQGRQERKIKAVFRRRATIRKPLTVVLFTVETAAMLLLRLKTPVLHFK